jgi:hypothetical protein
VRDTQLSEKNTRSCVLSPWSCVFPPWSCVFSRHSCVFSTLNWRLPSRSRVFFTSRRVSSPWSYAVSSCGCAFSSRNHACRTSCCALRAHSDAPSASTRTRHRRSRPARPQLRPGQRHCSRREVARHDAFFARRERAPDLCGWLETLRPHRAASGRERGDRAKLALREIPEVYSEAWRAMS